MCNFLLLLFGCLKHTDWINYTLIAPDATAWAGLDVSRLQRNLVSEQISAFGLVWCCCFWGREKTVAQCTGTMVPARQYYYRGGERERERVSAQKWTGWTRQGNYRGDNGTDVFTAAASMSRRATILLVGADHESAEKRREKATYSTYKTRGRFCENGCQDAAVRGYGSK